jgi:hypothetical protein
MNMKRKGLENGVPVSARKERTKMGIVKEGDEFWNGNRRTDVAPLPRYVFVTI